MSFTFTVTTSRGVEEVKYDGKTLIVTLIEPIKTPTCTTDAFGTKRWYVGDGKLHRLDGPAVEELCGTKNWYREGKLHREGGPAVEEYKGGKLCRIANYVDGKLVGELTWQS